MKEKLKANKNLIIGLVAVVVVAVIILCVGLFAKPSYKKQIKEFAKACASEEKMEKFVKKNVNLRAYYAMQESDEPKDMDAEYKKAKSKDYKNDEFVDKVVEAFKSYAEGETEIKVKDIGKMKKTSSDDGLLGKTLSDVKDMKTVKFKMEAEGEEVDCYAFFYKGKILMVMPDLDLGL